MTSTWIAVPSPAVERQLNAQLLKLLSPVSGWR